MAMSLSGSFIVMAPCDEEDEFQKWAFDSGKEDRVVEKMLQQS